MIPVVVGALGTVKKGMVENIKKVSEATTVIEIKKNPACWDVGKSCERC